MKQRQVNQRELRFDGVTARIGKDAHSNTTLVRMADPTDVWIHITNRSGPHCVIEAATHQVTDDMICECCAHMKPARLSSGLSSKKIEFTVTQISNLLSTKNPGEMIILDDSLVRKVFVR